VPVLTQAELRPSDHPMSPFGRQGGPIGLGVGIKHSNVLTLLLTPLRRTGHTAPNDCTRRSIRLLAGDGSLLCPYCGKTMPGGRLDPSSN
jgi:hypothetical protein